MLNAHFTWPVISQDIRMVSHVPVTRHEMALTRLRYGFSWDVAGIDTWETERSVDFGLAIWLEGKTQEWAALSGLQLSSVVL
jgi:hypothetical protein